MTETVYIGVGSNIDPENNVPAALELLKKSVCVTDASRCFRTQPIDRPDQDEYINCVWKIETDLEPEGLKRLLKDIEAGLGRVRTEDTYAARTIDLDMLVYGDQVLDTDIDTRLFLRAGLSDLDPGFSGPEDGALETDDVLYSVLRSHLSSDI